jgi:hypothetical protein
MKRFSILGLALLTVSALAAAFTPAKKEVKSVSCEGVLVATGDNDFTCSAVVGADDCQSNTTGVEDNINSSSGTSNGQTTMGATQHTADCN